jgi:hypothetical protein
VAGIGCVVDRGVQATEGLDRAVDEVSDGCLVAYVGGDGEGVTSMLDDLLGQVFKGVNVSGGHDDSRTGSGEGARCGATDLAVGADHQDDAANIRGHVLFASRR